MLDYKKSCILLLTLKPQPCSFSLSIQFLRFSPNLSSFFSISNLRFVVLALEQKRKKKKKKEKKVTVLINSILFLF